VIALNRNRFSASMSQAETEGFSDLIASAVTSHDSLGSRSMDKRTVVTVSNSSSRVRMLRRGSRERRTGYLDHIIKELLISSRVGVKTFYDSL